MATPTPQDTAYTALGLNVLIADKAIDVAGDVRTQVTERLGTVGENLDDVIERAENLLRQAGTEIDGRVKLTTELDKARKQARKQATTWRKSVDPIAEDFEARLPGNVSDFLATQRGAAWKVVGASKPRAKSTTSTTKS